MKDIYEQLVVQLAEQQWAYYARYSSAMLEAPTGQPYLDLKEALKEKETFVLSTNVDGQFERVFEKEQICNYQGNFEYFQCSQPCHDEIYENREMVEMMNQSIQGVCISRRIWQNPCMT